MFSVSIFCSSHSATAGTHTLRNRPLSNRQTGMGLLLRLIAPSPQYVSLSLLSPLCVSRLPDPLSSPLSYALANSMPFLICALSSGIILSNHPFS